VLAAPYPIITLSAAVGDANEFCDSLEATLNCASSSTCHHLTPSGRGSRSAIGFPSRAADGCCLSTCRLTNFARSFLPPGSHLCCPRRSRWAPLKVSIHSEHEQVSLPALVFNYNRINCEKTVMKQIEKEGLSLLSKQSTPSRRIHDSFPAEAWMSTKHYLRLSVE